ncbi:MAG: hypothetical protein ACRYG2_30755, partial [Janthinobacterium lividum]
LVDGCAAHLLEPPVNVLRLTLHPDGMAPRIQNLAHWRSHLLSQLQHRIERTADAGLSALLDELQTYPGGGAPRRSSAGPSDLVAALRLDHHGHTLSLFSITSHIDSAADVAIDEMTLETFYPADQQSAELLARPQAPVNTRSSSPLRTQHDGGEDGWSRT